MHVHQCAALDTSYVKFRSNPHAGCAVKRLVVMGGNEAYNDWTSTGAEFNFYCDPDAAEKVLSQVSLPLRTGHFLQASTLLVLYCLECQPCTSCVGRNLRQIFVSVQ